MAGILTITGKSHRGICVKNEIFHWYLVAQRQSQEDRQQNAIQKNLAKGIFNSPPPPPPCLLLRDSHFSPYLIHSFSYLISVHQIFFLTFAPF